MNNTHLPIKIGSSNTINTSLKTRETGTPEVGVIPSPGRRTDNPPREDIERQIEQDEKVYLALKDEILEKQITIGKQISLLTHYQDIEKSLHTEGTSRGDIGDEFWQKIKELQAWFEEANSETDAILAHLTKNGGELQ